MKKVLTAILAVIAIMSMSACGTHSVSTAADQVGLHYSGGPFSSKQFKDFIPASSKRWYGPGDKEFLYPNNKRTYDSTGGKDAERGPITSTSVDTVEMATKVSVTFRLTNDPTLLRKFHENIGNRYQAYMKDDAMTDGWRTMLEFYFGQALETTLDREIAGYKWRDLYTQPSLRVALQDKANSELEVILKQQMGEDYFGDISTLVQKPEPTNATLKENIAAQQNAVASAQSATAKAQADLATARAQTALANAEAAKKAAEIRGYGGFENYNKAQAVDKGLNPYQPTYLVNGTQPTK